MAVHGNGRTAAQRLFRTDAALVSTPGAADLSRFRRRGRLSSR
jgi:hypothetical protein